MATFMYTLVSMATFHCVARPEISPCTCATYENAPNVIKITCEGVSSFNQVVDAIQNKFAPELNIWLTISHSQLEDLETRTFGDMNIKLKNLRLNHDQIRVLPESSFRNLSHIEFLSLADNHLEEIPRRILNHMPNIGTADFGQGKIRRIYADDFRMLKQIKYLLLVNNNIEMLEKDSIPKSVMYVHLGRNNLTTLNGTLRHLEQLQVIFLNQNNLTTLDNELPIRSKNLSTILAHHNKLTKLPQDLKSFPMLDALYINDNELRSLDGLLKHASILHLLIAYNNKIEYLAEDEFLEAERIESLDLSMNLISSINGSLLPLKSLRNCNISGNNLTEFSLNDIRGLRDLRVLDLSFNRIEKLSGRMENIVESDSYVLELRLEHNLLKSLDGVMMGLNRLHVLSLAHNLLEGLSPDDLIGLEELEVLNVSHNNLQTLEETSKTFLPKLQRLDASYNNLTKLERDFHGLPVLCMADLSNNHIISISPELVAKTRCSSHGVVNKLEILLQENPILCQDELTELTGLMEAQETRLLGVAHCIVPVPKEDIPINPLSFVPQQLPPPPQIPIIPTNIINAEILTKSILESSPAIVQVIVPGPVLIQSMPSKDNEFIEKSEIPIITSMPLTTSTASPTVSKELPELANPSVKSVPAIETIIASISTEPAILPSSTTPNTFNFELNATVNEIDNAVHLPNAVLQNLTDDTQLPLVATTPVDPTISIVLEQQSVEVTTLPTVTTTATVKESRNQSSSVLPSQTNATPTLAMPTAVAETNSNEQDTEASAPESDNYVYETFSSVPQVFGPMSDRTQAQQLVIVEEPPEMLKDGVEP